MKINQNFLEKLIIKASISDPTFMSRIVDKLIPSFFSIKSYNIVYDFYKNFWNNHSKLPSLDEIKLFATDNSFLEAFKIVYNDTNSIELSSVDNELFYSNVEKFLKEKLALNTLNEVIDNINKKDIDPSLIVNKFEKIAGISLLFEKGYDLYKDVDRFVQSCKETSNKLPTGFSEIDKAINGGVLSDGKCLSIVTAPTNVGKSIMLANIGVNAAKQGKNVLIISLEMSEEVYASRIYSALYDLPINSINFMGEELKKEIEAHSYGNVIIKEFPPATMTVDQIDGYIDELYKAGNKFDLICIDYLTLIAAPGADNSNEAGKIVTRKLRALTYKYKLPIWTACQINREGMGEKTSELRHIAESIAIAAEADLIISLNQQPEDKDMNIMRVTFLKSRLGAKGFTINLFFNQKYLRFEDMGITQNQNITKEDKDMIETIEKCLTLDEIIENAI